MANYNDIKGTIKDYWQQVWDALKSIIVELDKNTKVDAKKLEPYYEDMRPLVPGDFSCSFCDRTKEAYNLVHGSRHTQTFEDMCVEEGCPALEPCRHDARKWQAFQPMACVWYFKEGQYFINEGNRYPMCQAFCQDFKNCEVDASTDTINFSELSYQDKMIKLKHCLYEMNRVGKTDNWADTIISFLGD